MLVVAVLGGVILFTGLGHLPPTIGQGAAALRTSSSTASPSLNSSCNAVFTRTPSALYVELPNPANNLTPNGTIFGALEVEIVNYTAANNGTLISFPGIFYKFPLATGGNFTMFIAPKTIAVTGPGWTDPTLMQRTVVVAGGLNFTPHAKASLTSQKVAVMANAHYGTLTLEARWHYGNTPVGKNHVVNSTWSVPATNASGRELPSIFEPAPYVKVTGTTGSTAVIGANYSANLTGTVGGERFFLEMEYPSGHVVQAHGQTAPLNATNFSVTITVINYVHSLSPGVYLVHIHDQCGALLFNKLVNAVFAPVAHIPIFFQPSACGSIVFGNTTYRNGSVANLTPSTTSYNFSLSGCRGLHFANWTTTGALHISGAHSILVSGSGTFTIRFI